MIVDLIKSKLDGNVSLCDVETTQNENGKFDLVLNSQGQLNRVIGIDKLAQHVLKFLIVRLGSYSDPTIGTNISNPKTEGKTDNSLRSEILASLSEYSKLQASASKNSTIGVGWDIYRTITPNVSTSWVKINKSLLANNFYFDGNLESNSTYYYSLVQVLNNNGIFISNNIGSYLSVTIPISDTYNAVIGNDFIIVPKTKGATLYWPQTITYQSEEVLKRIVKLNSFFDPGDPRDLSIYLELTNLNSQITSVAVTA